MSEVFARLDRHAAMAVFLASTASACSNSSASARPSAPEPSQNSSESEESSTSQSTSSGQVTSAPTEPILADLPTQDAGLTDCLVQCSPDLKAVWDCHGHVQRECEAGLACLAGACVEDACAAADANESSIACEYWALRPDMLGASAQGGCFAVIIANTWSVPIHIDVEWKGLPLTGSEYIRLPRGQGQTLEYRPYDAVAGLAPQDVALLFLGSTHPEDSPFSGCPSPPYVMEQTGVLGTTLGDAFRIETTGPVVAYSAAPYGADGASSSYSLLLPTSRWGREYVVANAYAAGEEADVGPLGNPSLNILALEDETHVTMLPGVAIEGGPDVVPGPAGEPYVVTLHRGQYVQITQHDELTGSPVASDKPIGVWGGHSCMNIPVAAHACDSAHQQLPPVSALGHQYVGARYPNRATASREEATPWRLIGTVDGTHLSWDGVLADEMPAQLNSGEMLEFWHTGPFTVESQSGEYPFYLGQYMTSASYVAERAYDGDPEWVNVVPTDQYLRHYVFFTDPTFPETNLVVVRKPDTEGTFADVTLQCKGVLDGWIRVGGFEYTTVQLSTGFFENVGECSNGVQVMESDGLFSVTAWGWGNAPVSTSMDTNSAFNSYAFPAAIGLRTVNQVELKRIHPQLR